jgi:hypothetical protein
VSQAPSSDGVVGRGSKLLLRAQKHKAGRLDAVELFQPAIAAVLSLQYETKTSHRPPNFRRGEADLIDGCIDRNGNLTPGLAIIVADDYYTVFAASNEAPTGVCYCFQKDILRMSHEEGGRMERVVSGKSDADRSRRVYGCVKH